MTTKPETSADKDESQAPLSLNALSRRRALLSGLGKGGAVLAATVPLQSLAGSTVLTCKNQTTGGTVIATVSGTQSAVHSFIAGGGVTQVPACGKTIAYWCKATWPTGTGCITKTTTYKSCFGDIPTGGSSTTTCWTVLNNASTYGDCSHWVAAYLNGSSQYISGSGVYPYPHTTSGSVKGVKAWYQDSSNKARALALFKQIQTANS